MEGFRSRSPWIYSSSVALGNAAGSLADPARGVKFTRLLPPSVPYGLHDPLAVAAAVLDEDLVGVVAGGENAGNEDARYVRLHRVRIVVRDARNGIELHAERAEQRAVRGVAGHREHEIVVKLILRARVLDADAHGVRSDRNDARAEARLNGSFLQPSFNVGAHPRLHVRIERIGEMHNGDARTPAMQLQCCIHGAVSAANDDDI